MAESQARHLAKWKAQQKQARGDILYMPAGEQWQQLQDENAKLRANIDWICKINKTIVLTVAAAAGVGMVALLVHYFDSWLLIPASISLLVIIESFWKHRTGKEADKQDVGSSL